MRWCSACAPHSFTLNWWFQCSRPPPFTIRAGIFENPTGAFALYPITLVLALGFVCAVFAAGRARRARFSGPYLSGAQTADPESFEGPMNKPVAVSSGIYYFESIFGEEKLTVLVQHLRGDASGAPDRRSGAMRGVVLVIIGVVGAPLLGGLIAGVDRRLTAWFQSRYGPPVWQPFFDVAKLFGKEKLLVNTWQVVCAYIYITAAMLSVVLFFLQSDLLLILFVQAVGAIFLVMGAFSATSPYSQVGANRELIQILTYEPLIILVFVGIYLATGSFKISEIYSQTEPLLKSLPLLYIVLGYALTIKLRKSPFDFSTSHHAHQELVKGFLTEYSGPYLALVEIGHWYEVVLILGPVLAFLGHQLDRDNRPCGDYLSVRNPHRQHHGPHDLAVDARLCLGHGTVHELC